MHRRSKALAAGVEVGDTLLAINGRQCQHWTTDQAMRTINDSLPGHDVTLHLLRCDDDCVTGFVRYEMRRFNVYWKADRNQHSPTHIS